MFRALLAVLCSLLMAGCHGGGSHAASTRPASPAPAKVAAPTPPSDHGGYFGAGAKAYDAAFIECYEAAFADRDPQPNSNSLSFVRLRPGHRLATLRGCQDGTHQGTTAP
jgi:hypothetical protein